MLEIKVEGLETMNAQLRQFERKLKVTTQSTLEAVADRAAKECAEKTFPRGTSDKTRDTLQKSILKDVNKAYADDKRIAAAIATTSPRMAAAYLQAREQGKHDTADYIARKTLEGYAGQASDNGEYLERLRTKNGRVPRSQRKRVEESKLEQIKATKILKAGLVKSGWFQCMAKARVPQWLQKAAHLGERTVTPLLVTLTNRVRYAGRMIRPAMIQKAIFYAFKNELKRYARTKFD